MITRTHTFIRREPRHNDDCSLYRVEVDGSDLLLPRVSTINDYGNQFNYVRWLMTYQKLSQFQAEAVQSQAFRRGTLTHLLIESFFRQQPGDLPISPDQFTGLTEEDLKLIEPYWQNAKPTLEAIRAAYDVVLLEHCIFHPLLGYAGTADAILKAGNDLVVFDWKTKDISGNPNKPHEATWNQKLQLTAYAMAFNRELMSGSMGTTSRDWLIKTAKVVTFFNGSRTPLITGIDIADYSGHWIKQCYTYALGTGDAARAGQIRGHYHGKVEL